MEKKTTKAAFGLNDYKFTKVEVYYDLAPKEDNELSVNFAPSGVFSIEKKSYELTIEFCAFDETLGLDKSFIKTSIAADFGFEHVKSIDEIPNFFYKNSMAIVYPYIRAFVSNLSLQANIGPLILPTLNLSMLEGSLKENTTAI